MKSHEIINFMKSKTVHETGRINDNYPFSVVKNLMSSFEAKPLSITNILKKPNKLKMTVLLFSNFFPHLFHIS